MGDKPPPVIVIGMLKCILTYRFIRQFAALGLYTVHYSSVVVMKM